MLLKKFTLDLGAILLLVFAGCAGTAQKTTSDNSQTMGEKLDSQKINNTVAQEARAHNYVEISFDQGSATLSDSAKTSLDAVVEQARTSGKIDEVLVFSWADEEFPSKNLKKLSKQQRDLAEKRGDAIEKYMKSKRSLDVDSYSMAERSNALSRWFNTTDSKLKNAFTSAGLPTSADSNQYPSKASHAVILVKVE